MRVADFLETSADGDEALAIPRAVVDGARAKQIPIDVTTASDTTSSCFTKGYVAVEFHLCSSACSARGKC